ncbi:Tetratricopeptide repeat [Ostreococcus tauri]|uniref:Tetratricopeptide repeat n=1 Tax=Ostreococcus tauri TaxID=70448 RepID=A0A090LZX4_OSTTA|nr:Tetratricopeptide repeat [Ostreococcus tauri]CEF97481.1 Tetratricopeptide repeat [Ostreococcus tauri]|eukprot:XP_003078658.3 Tetratricopeptide repeat [Ostreococcus tauri]
MPADAANADAQTFLAAASAGSNACASCAFAVERRPRTREHGFDDSWLRDGRTMRRHAYGAATVTRLYRGMTMRPTSAAYETVERGWIDVGVSSAFDARELEAAEDEDAGAREEREEVGEHDAGGRRGERSTTKEKVQFFTTSVKPSGLQHMLNKYGGTVESAMDAITHRLEIDPDNPFLLTDLGQVHRMLADNERAAECFARALRVVKHPELYQYLGTTLMVTGRIEEAIDAFSQGAAQFPKDISNRFSLALVSLQQEDVHGAISTLEAVVREDSNYAGGLAQEHLHAAKMVLQRRSSNMLDAGIFIMFVITIVVIAGLRFSLYISKKRSKKHKRK